MEKDLLAGLGIADDEEATETESVISSSEEQDVDQKITKEPIESLRQMVEDSLMESMERVNKSSVNNMMKQQDKESLEVNFKTFEIEGELTNNENVSSLMQKKESELSDAEKLLREFSLKSLTKLEENVAPSVNDESVVEENISATYKAGSISTATSTIPPEEIREKLRKALEKRRKNEEMKRIVVKGEASAVTRRRRENRDTIKDCSGIWGWE